MSIMPMCRVCRNEVGRFDNGICVACSLMQREFGEPDYPEPDYSKEPPFDPYEFEINPEGRKRAGYLVITKSGKTGRTFHSDLKVNGKVPVHIEGMGKPMLCDPSTLTVQGFID